MYHLPPPPSLLDFSYLWPTPEQIWCAYPVRWLKPSSLRFSMPCLCQAVKATVVCLLWLLIEKHQGSRDSSASLPFIHRMTATPAPHGSQGWLLLPIGWFSSLSDNVRKPLVLQWRIHWNHYVLPDGKIYSSHCSLSPYPHPKLGNSMRNTIPQWVTRSDDERGQTYFYPLESHIFHIENRVLLVKCVYHILDKKASTHQGYLQHC